jgi:hypothetical protein
MAWAVGRNLGLILGGLAIIAILAPTIVLAETSWRGRVIIVIGIGCGIAAIWLGCIFNDSITFWEWGRCVVVLIVFGFTVGGLAALLVRIRLSPPAAAAIVVVLALAWLSWPIWLAPAIRGAGEDTVGGLVAANPTFAIQGALFKSFPVPWVQHAIAYRLTNLGDDLPYLMPTSILRCVIAHALIALIAWSAAQWPARRVHQPAGQ